MNNYQRLGVGFWFMAILYFVSGDISGFAEWFSYLLGLVGIIIYARSGDE